MMKKIIIGVSAFFVPMIAFAQLKFTSQDATGVVKFIQDSLNVATGLIISFAVVYLLYGIFQYVKAGDDDERKEGRNKMVYGIIGIAVMVSVWGIVRILVTTAGTGTAPSIPPPALPTSNL